MVVPKLQRRNRSRHIDEVINDGVLEHYTFAWKLSVNCWKGLQLILGSLGPMWYLVRFPTITAGTTKSSNMASWTDERVLLCTQRSSQYFWRARAIITQHIQKIRLHSTSVGVCIHVLSSNHQKMSKTTATKTIWH